MPTIEVNLPRPHKGQQVLEREAKRFNVVCCGRRWGKTKYGITLGMRHMLAGKPVGWFAPGYKFLAEAYRDFKRVIPSELIAHKNDADYRIELVTGGVLECWTTEGGDPGRSRKYARAIYDEAAKDEALTEVYQKAIRACLADLRGDMWFLSSPRGLDDFHGLYLRGQPGAHHRDGWASWIFPTATNPYIHPDEIEDARKELSEAVFRQEFLGEFVAEVGDYFKRADFTGRLYQAEAMPDLWRFLVVDLALSQTEESDYTGILACGIDHKRDLYVCPGSKRMRERSGRTLAQAIVDSAIAQDAKLILVENTHMWKGIRSSVEEEMRGRGRWFKVEEVTPTRAGNDPTRDAKQARARSAQALAQWNRVWLPDDAFTADILLPELLSFPAGRHDDLVDCLAMAANWLQRSGTGAEPVPTPDEIPPRSFANRPLPPKPSVPGPLVMFKR